MKKAIYVFLVLAALLGIFTVNSFAADTEGDTAQKECALKFREFLEQFSDDKTGETVVNMYLCSHKTDNWPHTWVYFENVSDDTVYVGPYELAAGEGVSSGSFGLSVEDGAGIYFNIETYRKTCLEESAELACIMTELNEKELAKVSRFIVNHNFWDFGCFNCCFYALGCWNAGGGVYFYPSLVSPSLARELINMYSPITDISVIKKDPDGSEVYRLKGIGRSAYLQPVKQETLDG